MVFPELPRLHHASAALLEFWFDDGFICLPRSVGLATSFFCFVTVEIKDDFRWERKEFWSDEAGFWLMF